MCKCFDKIIFSRPWTGEIAVICTCFSTTTSDDANLQITVRSNNKVARTRYSVRSNRTAKEFPIGNGFCVEDPMDGRPPHCWNRGVVIKIV
ncbi:hypothetical protein CEXT_19471 [Caerostris extrusa]|uniref:Uncharacterized protein n=1 Tax=Caerostris extrusa TaxID=172846 RepID=A0AAV4Y6K5_CAEEX|nr:hypothetical protein CEXT_19471 [Caerostris extrusa]